MEFFATKTVKKAPQWEICLPLTNVLETEKKSVKIHDRERVEKSNNWIKYKTIFEIVNTYSDS